MIIDGYKKRVVDDIVDLYIKIFGAVLIEGPKWCGIEIKLGASQIEEAANNLVRINKLLANKGGKEAKSLCVICALTNAAYKRKDGVYVVPITSLKN